MFAFYLFIVNYFLISTVRNPIRFIYKQASRIPLSLRRFLMLRNLFYFNFSKREMNEKKTATISDLVLYKTRKYYTLCISYANLSILVELKTT